MTIYDILIKLEKEYDITFSYDIILKNIEFHIKMNDIEIANGITTMANSIYVTLYDKILYNNLEHIIYGDYFGGYTFIESRLFYFYNSNYIFELYNYLEKRINETHDYRILINKKINLYDKIYNIVNKLDDRNKKITLAKKILSLNNDFDGE